MTPLRFAALWLSPVALLGLAVQVYAGTPGGALSALLLVLVPCLAVLVSDGDGLAEPSLFVVVVTLLAAVLLLTANLSMIGDLATAAGAPRWHGVFVAAGCAFAMTMAPFADRVWPWLTPAALAPLSVVLGAVIALTGVDPLSAWTAAASRVDLRFSSSSPWVVTGGTFRAPGRLAFAEPQTVKAPSAGVFRVLVPDGPSPGIREWRPESGESLALRPGDQLWYDAGARLRFGEGARIPGSPRSGAAWAESSPERPAAVHLVETLGLCVTVALGGIALLGPWAPALPAGAAIALALVVGAVWWAVGWAISAAWLAPELLLGDARAGSLIQLPAYVFDEPWGRRLAGVLLASLIALFVASASALRARIGALDRGGGELGRDVVLWAGMFGVAAVASLWPSDPWAMLLLGLGVVASSVGGVRLFGRRAPSWIQTLAGACALFVFAVLVLAARVSAGSVLEPFTAYPSLVAAPVCGVVLRLARVRPA